MSDLPLGDASPVSGSGGVSLRGRDEGRAAEVTADPRRRALSRKARAALPLETVGAGMLVRWFCVRPTDVVFVKGVVEASDGLAAVFAEQGGELLLATPREREAELGELLADLEAELGAYLGASSVAPVAPAAGAP
jgi:hypothetical protein